MKKILWFVALFIIIFLIAVMLQKTKQKEYPKPTGTFQLITPKNIK